MKDICGLPVLAKGLDSQGNEGSDPRLQRGGGEVVQVIAQKECGGSRVLGSGQQGHVEMRNLGRCGVRGSQLSKWGSEEERTAAKQFTAVERTFHSGIVPNPATIVSPISSICSCAGWRCRIFSKLGAKSIKIG